MRRKGYVLLAIFAVMVALLSSGCDSKSQKSTIEIKGVVDKVEYIAEGSSFNAPDIKKTIVRFKDGRIKAFNGISNAVFQEGKVNIIVYDRRNRIVSVRIER